MLGLEDVSSPLPLEGVAEEEEVFAPAPPRRPSAGNRARRESKPDEKVLPAEATIVPSPQRPVDKGRSYSFDDDSGWTSTSSSAGSDDFESASATDTDDEEPLAVPLEPYGHKVGGHSSIYQFTRAAICKPLVGRENVFYEDMERLAPGLLPFVPRYLGVMLELFIFMEDLTGKLKKPCVLDLKMGTRQYGFDATPLKKTSQRKKCDQTTSRTLGVRMCGMQVWSNATQSFVSKNKYRGRQLKTEEFPRVLSLYLNDGNNLLVQHIPPLMQKLYSLASILVTLNGFRFYGCSLLLIYDGD
ncbi:SAICAR synthase-like protein, partial [Cutaneotrichosporon oleaginosum]